MIYPMLTYLKTLISYPSQTTTGDNVTSPVPLVTSGWAVFSRKYILLRLFVSNMVHHTFLSII